MLITKGGSYYIILLFYTNYLKSDIILLDIW